MDQSDACFCYPPLPGLIRIPASERHLQKRASKSVPPKACLQKRLPSKTLASKSVCLQKR
eukprot:773007-Prorocentrum_minimum.AAC.1